MAAWQSGQHTGSVTAEDVAAVVSGWTGVPVTTLTEAESDRLLRLEEELHRRVVGQEEAVQAVAKAVRRGRGGAQGAGQAHGDLLFLGPTGVGKTELCKALAAVLFGSEEALLRFDMSEYMERHTVSRLIGSPPGYVGHEEGGQLTEKVRRKPTPWSSSTRLRRPTRTSGAFSSRSWRTASSPSPGPEDRLSQHRGGHDLQRGRGDGYRQGVRLTSGGGRGGRPAPLRSCGAPSWRPGRRSSAQSF